jgi:hypothetical protein
VTVARDRLFPFSPIRELLSREKRAAPGREKRNGDAGVGGHIAYSIAYATDLHKRGPVLSLQVIQNVGKIWWAHKDSNLGPAD